MRAFQAAHNLARPTTCPRTGVRLLEFSCLKLALLLSSHQATQLPDHIRMS